MKIVLLTKCRLCDFRNLTSGRNSHVSFPDLEDEPLSTACGPPGSSLPAAPAPPPAVLALELQQCLALARGVGGRDPTRRRTQVGAAVTIGWADGRLGVHGARRLFTRARVGTWTQDDHAG